jgi:hypothetical protein
MTVVVAAFSYFLLRTILCSFLTAARPPLVVKQACRDLFTQFVFWLYPLAVLGTVHPVSRDEAQSNARAARGHPATHRLQQAGAAFTLSSRQGRSQQQYLSALSSCPLPTTPSSSPAPPSKQAAAHQCYHCTPRTCRPSRKLVSRLTARPLLRANCSQTSSHGTRSLSRPQRPRTGSPTLTTLQGLVS